ncbi:MAG: cyclodeaminase/cyclohydrolase family protein [Gemmatimonadales bacterium]
MDDTDELSIESSIQQWLDAVAAPSATPAGGSAAALATALAASLVTMVAGMTTRREKYAAVHGHAQAALERADLLRAELLELAAYDAEAVGEYLEALRLPQGTEFERTAREAARKATLLEAARVQMELLHQASDVAELAEAMTGSGVATAIGDAATAAFLAVAAGRSAYWSVRSNLKSLATAEDTRYLLDTAMRAMEQLEDVEVRVRQLLDERVG